MIRDSAIWLDLSDASPPEVGKQRPAVIVSNSVQNQSLDTLVAVPLSSLSPEISLLRIKLQVSGLKSASFAIVPGIRQLKKSRILGAAGKVKQLDLDRLDRAIREYLSD